MDKKKDTSGRGRVKKESIAENVVRFFNESQPKAYNYKQIGSAMGLKKLPQLELLVDVLEGMALTDFLVSVGYGKYKLNEHAPLVEGVFKRSSNGKNQVLPDDESAPVFVADRNSLRAMGGDRVSVRLFARRANRDLEGEVVEIVERSQKQFVGVLHVQKNFAFLITDSRALGNDIFIPKNKLGGAKEGQKVVVRITDWPDSAKNPYGEVIDVLGNVGENDTEIHAILAEFGLPYRYPEEVEKAAEVISEVISEEEIARREDFRGIPTFTIDPKDAKDFDDALSIRTIGENKWEIGVHIADVTHYVLPNDTIDKEAQSRATSVYLVDRVVPMLPERLSNGLCSLRPDEDKLCFSVIVEMNDKGKVLKHRIARTVIRSQRRFAYEEAQTVIETGEGDMRDEILTLDRLAKVLREKRYADGAINFDRYEVKFEIDEKGKPIGVYFKVSKDANKLIEEFMLLANRTVAEFVGKVAKGKTPKTFVYRVHDLPDPDKLENFAQFIRRFGYKVNVDGKKSDVSKSINELLDIVSGKREENLIETVAIRSMAKAVYSTENIGHYGLAFDYYSHFTSPIRRYPDMMAHRLLQTYMDNGKSANQKYFEEQCEHSSAMEQLAAQAERASIKYKQVEFMSDKLGEEFDGVISGVTEWGIYVELNESKCEGLVHIRELDNDYFELDEKNYALIGRKSKKVYRLGDDIRIKVVRANLERKQLDFGLVSSVIK